MDTKIKAFLMFLTTILLAVVWIFGIILIDFRLFILGMIIAIVLFIYTYKHLDEMKILRSDDGEGNVIEDERDDIINEKAGIMTFDTMMALIVTSGICILTLRNVYPEYELIAYVLLLVALIAFIINKISKFYYKKAL